MRERACGVRISSGTRPSSTGRIRLAAQWIVSPSGICPYESRPRRAMAEGILGGQAAGCAARWCCVERRLREGAMRGSVVFEIATRARQRQGCRLTR